MQSVSLSCKFDYEKKNQKGSYSLGSLLWLPYNHVHTFIFIFFLLKSRYNHQAFTTPISPFFTSWGLTGLQINMKEQYMRAESHTNNKTNCIVLWLPRSEMSSAAAVESRQSLPLLRAGVESRRWEQALLRAGKVSRPPSDKWEAGRWEKRGFIARLLKKVTRSIITQAFHSENTTCDLEWG